MTYYFNLQLKRVNRHLEALGFNVMLAYLLAGLAFVGASQLLFEKIKFAQYVYVSIALWILYLQSEPNRNSYLQLLFHRKTYHFIRLIENTLIAIPFIAFLLYQNFFKAALIVIIPAWIFSFLRFAVINQLVLPTPFFKKPFEFITGFRKYYLLYAALYILLGVAIYVNNFNLGVFSLIVGLLATLNFYTKPEPLFYVWTHAFSPTQFLMYKVKTALLHSLLLAFPMVVALFIFYISYWYIICIVVLLGMLYLLLMLLGKYAYYPAEVNLKPLIALALSVLFPPFLCIVLPYFYIKAKQNLSQTVL